MTRIISVANQKGGVGKTTTTVNLGACLANLGKKVLLIDIDAQGNATSGMGVPKPDVAHDVYDVLVNEEPITSVVQHTSRENLDIVPATIQLAGAEIELTSMMARESRLKLAIDEVRDMYDFVLIDCPPSLGHLTINAFTASDSILIPVQCEYYALEGLSQLLNTIRLVQKHFNPELKIEGVLLTMYDARTNLGAEVVEEVRKYFREKVYDTIIPRNVRLSEAPSHGLPIIDYDIRSKGAKGLGRGIDALFQDIAKLEDVDVKNEQVTEILLNELRPNPYQPRKTFDETSLQELANSILHSGVFQPIIVRKSAVKGYEIIAGERRFRASKLAGKEKIPAIIREFDEESMMQVAVLENLQREDLNPLEEAEAYEMLMKNLKLTQAEVAERLGKSRPYIANYLRLLTLPDAVKAMVQKQSMSMGQARTLLGLKNKEQLLPLANRCIKDNLTVRQLEQLVAELNETQGKKGKKAKKAIKEKPIYIRESEDRLMDKFGTTVAIQEKEGKGKIEIEYLSSSDLARILDILDIHFDEE